MGAGEVNVGGYPTAEIQSLSLNASETGVNCGLFGHLVRTYADLTYVYKITLVFG